MTSPKAAATAAAFLSTALISLAPNLLLLLFPRYAEGGSHSADAALSLGQALAAGGLLGDVFLHTLPEVIEEDGKDGKMVGMLVLAGFGAFLAFDVLVRDLGHNHHHHDSAPDQNGRNGHGHGHGHSDAVKPLMNGGSKDHASCPSAFAGGSRFTSTVLLNLAADSLHNFTDGLAVGASFAASPPPGDCSSLSLLPAAASMIRSRGGLAALSILFHEVPHELGDFAILVSSGFSRGQAIKAQFSTALAAFLGTAVGLSASWGMGQELGHDVFLLFTAGGFIYLAAVSILPDLLKGEVGVKMRAAQIAAFAAGVAFMWAVATLEHHGEGHTHHDNGHHHHHGHHHHSHHHSHEL